MSSSSHRVPSTSNGLSHSQRLRLVRSTRKLGEMLGTTPVINGSASDFGQQPAASSGASSSLQHSSSLRLSRKGKGTKVLPRPLVLSLHALPASHRVPAGPTTPLSPTSIATNTPSYHDDFEVDDLLQARRRRMAKLTRTLGENIPPELVFSSARRSSRPRSCSVDAAALAATFQVTVVSPIEPTFHQPPTPTRSSSLHVLAKPRTLASRLRNRHGHASSLGMEGLHLQEVATFAPSRKSSESDASVSTTYSSKSMKETYRKQAGWSGEWNRQDIQEVMNRLRGLKA